jgi:nitrate reductase gamma subunit
MHLLPYLAAYAAILTFSIAVVMRFRMWAKMPMHVRWELYPVAHEGKRAKYGGSYLEETKWWEKPREVSLIGELKVMIPEILFLVALRENNPKLWAKSFPFHFGLYMLSGCVGLMFFQGLLDAISPSLVAGGFGSLLQYGIMTCGYVGLGLALFGAYGLLQRRLHDPEMQDFTTPADIFNLGFFLAVFGWVLLTILLVDRDFSSFTAFVHNLLTFHIAPLPFPGFVAIPLSVSIILLSALLTYIPLTHMSHFIGKYFAYHAIRWDDEPNLAGGPKEKEIHGVLARKVTWAAPHIQGDGKKSWADVATEDQQK